MEMWKLVSYAIALIVFGLVLTGLYFNWGKIKGYINEAIEFPSLQLAELKKSLGLMGEKEAAEKMKELGKLIEHEKMVEESKKMQEILIDATKNIKDRNYDDALSNYTKFYRECEKEYTPPGATTEVEYVSGKWSGPMCNIVTKEGVKFRILNVLREKFFSLYLVPDFEKSAEEFKNFDSINYAKSISKPELESALYILKKASALKRGEYSRAQAYDKECSEFDSFSELYCKMVSWYVGIYYNKVFYNDIDETRCERGIIRLNEMKEAINKNLRLFEYKDQNKPILKALDYQFVNVPNSHINELCGVS